jgi:hypothetical protein
MVVDDCPASAKLIEEILRSGGYEVSGHRYAAICLTPVAVKGFPSSRALSLSAQVYSAPPTSRSLALYSCA